MSTKLTLTLDNKIIENAKIYAKENKISLSKLVEFYFKSLSNNYENQIENLPPITKELSGIAKIKTTKSDKELLVALMLLLICISLLFLNSNFASEEGMWPISEIHKINLKEKGLNIDLKDIYNPDGISLIDGIVKVGGCTGSFVSPNGLILTNHHCAYRAIQAASRVEQDYLSTGFYAKDKTEEIQSKGYTVRIT